MNAAPATPGPPPAPGAPGPFDLTAMRRALELARDAAALGEIPVGAVVFRSDTGQILGEGHNLRHTRKDPTLHAEIVAIRAAAERIGDWRLNACTLAVTLEPCPMCAGAIVNARIGRLLFGCADPKAGACGSLLSITTDARLNHRVTPQGGLLAAEAAALLQAFFADRRRAGG